MVAEIRRNMTLEIRRMQRKALSVLAGYSYGGLSHFDQDSVSTVTKLAFGSTVEIVSTV